jgi:hypothetical protein
VDESDVIFRCAPELLGYLPPPIPAVTGLPDWFKTMPTQAHSDVYGGDMLTVKKCPPFIDAMTYGFLMPLAADLHCRDGEFTWEKSVPFNSLGSFTRAPIDFHDNSQVQGTPYFDDDQFIIKFNNFWTIELPPGYSVLITHPVNRADLPFVSMAGMVDADRYRNQFINFPARWIDPDFSGVLPRGTPIVQCFPFRRDKWESRTEAMTPEGLAEFEATRTAIDAGLGVYRKYFRAQKK